MSTSRSRPSPTRLKSLLQRLRGRRILVAGDIMLDEYLIGRVARISPEAPIPIFELEEEYVTPGAGAYVSSLIENLGGQVELCGVVGDDANGARLRGLLQDRGIATDGVFADPARPTTIKTRVISQNQQMIRIDRERLQAIPDSLSRQMASFMDAAIRRVDAVILSDYDKGTFSASLIRNIIRSARRHRRVVAVNPKPPLAMEFRGATFVSMNHFEASVCLKRPLPDEEAIERGGVELRRKLHARAVLVTRREQGMALFAGTDSCMIPTHAKEVFDGTGAGDTVIAVVGLALAAGGRLTDCVHLANIAAGVEVGKLGCALVSPEEIRRSI